MKGWTDTALDIMLASLSPATIKQYESALKLWWEFCILRDIDPLRGETYQILQFLTEKFENGAAYGTLNSARSAISLIVEENISDNADIKRFFKGIFRLKPKKPKYDKIWNTDKVLDKLAILHPLEKLTLTELTEKTVMLLALATAQRAQTLSLIKTQNITLDETGYEIRITDLIKTSKPGKKQPLLKIPFFRDTPEWCVASTLKRYIEVTHNLRGNITNLFISTKKPYVGVSAQTISRWLKTVLNKSGITDFSGHSTRHATTSKAFKEGLDIDIIKNAAGWSEKSSFRSVL